MAEGLCTATETASFRPVLADPAPPSEQHARQAQPSQPVPQPRPVQPASPREPIPPGAPTDGPGLLALLAQRRSIRRLRPGPFPESAQARLLEAVRLTPTAYNTPSTHVVLVHAERAAFWRTVETCLRERLEGERRERYLDRLAGFRDGVGVALVFEDTAARAALMDAWTITEAEALAFAEQGLGMVQLSLWLALTADGLATSLQHWEWLIADRVCAFARIPSDRFRLAAILPFGYPDEAPRPVDPIPLDRYRS